MKETAGPNSAAQNYFDALAAPHFKLVSEVCALITGAAKEKGLELVVFHAPDDPDFGRPELTVKRGNEVLGYVALSHSGRAQKRSFSAQFARRYELYSDNLLATDGEKWVWLNYGGEYANFRVEPDEPGAKAELSEMLSGFFEAQNYQYRESYELSLRLAARAALLQRQINRAFQIGPPEPLAKFYEEHSQLQYFGLLTARSFSFQISEAVVWLALTGWAKRPDDPLNKKNWTRGLPRQLQFIGDFLKALEKASPKYEGFFAELRALLNAAPDGLRAELVYSKVRKKSRRDNLFGYYDPWLEFRERFRSAFRDAKAARSRNLVGQKEILRFVERQSGFLVRQNLSIKDGLADLERARVLLPETSSALPGLFARVLDSAPPKSGKRDATIRKHLLRHFFAFERDLSELAFGLLRLTSFLVSDNYALLPTERIPIFLTDAFRYGEAVSAGAAQGWKDEARRSARLKKAVAPFLLHSVFADPFDPPRQIGATFESGGKQRRATRETPLGETCRRFLPEQRSHLERKFSSFYDDPGFKALAWYGRRLSRQKEGLYWLLTSQSWLTKPIARKLREELLEICADIYLVSIDEPEDISGTPAVSVKSDLLGEDADGLVLVMLVKYPAKTEGRARVFEYRLEGAADSKLKQLENVQPDAIEWNAIACEEPDFAFSRKRQPRWRLYESGWNLQDIFQRDFRGLKGGRDYALDESGGGRFSIAPMLNAPGDWPSAAPEETEKLRAYFEELNFALVCAKATRNPLQGAALPAVSPADEYFLGRDRIVRQFPLYRPGERIEEGIFAGIGQEAAASSSRKLNFSPEFLHYWRKSFPEIPPVEAFFVLIALLNAPAYLSEFAEPLSVDWPRAIFPANEEEVRSAAKQGRAFCAFVCIDISMIEALAVEDDLLHRQWKETVSCGLLPVYEEVRVEYVAYDAAGRIRLNKNQALENVPEYVYRAQVGGYRPLPHFLNQLIGESMTARQMEYARNLTRCLALMEWMKKNQDK